MRRRMSNSSEDLSESSSLRRLSQLQAVKSKTSTDHLNSLDSSTNGLTHSISASTLSPLWGEPGRRLPSVSSMLQLPPPMLAQQSSGNLADDIEDLGRESLQRDDLLIEELAKASPRVLVEISLQDRLCPKCRMPDCQVSQPPPGYYSRAEVSKHRTPGDLWITAHGFVYDCSRYLTKHPGGSRTILSRAGMDASNDFDFHTRAGKSIWKRLQVGRLASCSYENGGSRPGAQTQDEQCTIS